MSLDDDSAQEINWLIDLISQIRSVRAEMNVPAGATLPLIVVGADGTASARLATHDAAIKRLARIDTIQQAETAPKGSAQIVLESLTLCLPLAGVIDLAAEKARLAKERGRLDGEIARIDKKLANPKFVEKAPEEVVDGEKEKRAEFVELRDKVEQAETRLSQMG